MWPVWQRSLPAAHAPAAVRRWWKKVLRRRRVVPGLLTKESVGGETTVLVDCVEIYIV
jgi:hypothetical protein